MSVDLLLLPTGTSMAGRVGMGTVLQQHTFALHESEIQGGYCKYQGYHKAVLRRLPHNCHHLQRSGIAKAVPKYIFAEFIFQTLCRA